MTQLQRDAVKELFRTSPDLHAGLWLARGLPKWDADTKGKDFPAHIKRATELNIPAIYKNAYDRWQEIVLKSEGTIAFWCGQLDGRLFIGLGGASVMETAITLSRTYGVPVIPGSALKGLAHAYAEARIKEVKEDHKKEVQLTRAKEWIFGKVGEKPEDSYAGYVLFHDAWWIPDSAKTPLCQEIVTVHHQDYYNGTAKKATDFDSPIPNAQIAARGSFLFAVECGNPEWAESACDLLKKALMDWGIGGKTAAGYGRFQEDKKYQQELKNEADKKIAGEQQRQQEIAEQEKLAGMSPLEREIEEVAKTNTSQAKYITVLQALEKGQWQGDDCKRVAEVVKQWMVKDGVWKEKTQARRPEGDGKYQRTLKIIKFLKD